MDRMDKCEAILNGRVNNPEISPSLLKPEHANARRVIQALGVAFTALYRAITMQKKLSFILKLAALATAFFAASSYADNRKWELIHSAPDAKSYIDRQSIEFDSTFRRAWLLLEFSVPRETGEKSAYIETEFDCTKKKARQLYFITYTELRGEGEELISSDNPYDHWDNTTPDSPNGIALKLVCSAKKKGNP